MTKQTQFLWSLNVYSRRGFFPSLLASLLHVVTLNSYLSLSKSFSFSFSFFFFFFFFLKKGGKLLALITQMYRIHTY